MVKEKPWLDWFELEREEEEVREKLVDWEMKERAERRKLALRIA